MPLTKKQAHQPFFNEVLDAKGIVLFIHGIIGGPYQFKDLATIANEQGYSSCAILLPGHGTTAERFSRVDKQVWMNYTEQIISRLIKDYNEVIIVGHSMGCLLTLLASLKYPQITKAFLISTPLKIKLSVKGLKYNFKVAFGEVEQDNLYNIAIYRGWSIQRAKYLITYLQWIPRYLDLFSLIRQTNKNLKNIKIPLAIVHCKDDEFVSDQSIRVFKTRLECEYNILKLYKSGHFYFTSDEKKRLNHHFRSFLKK